MFEYYFNDVIDNVLNELIMFFPVFSQSYCLVTISTFLPTYFFLDVQLFKCVIKLVMNCNENTRKMAFFFANNKHNHSSASFVSLIFMDLTDWAFLWLPTKNSRYYWMSSILINCSLNLYITT